MKIYGAKAGGSAIVELVAEDLGMAYELEYLEWETLDAQDEAIIKLNPVGQIPILKIEDEVLLTETGAILTYLNSLHPTVGLIPSFQHPKYPEFVRWFFFLYSSIYPTFVYGDHPMRWVAGVNEATDFRSRIDAHRCQLWSHMEQAADSPYFLGETKTMIDWSLAVMTTWRPHELWFAKHCPKLHAIATRMRHTSIFKHVAQRNFSESMTNPAQ